MPKITKHHGLSALTGLPVKLDTQTTLVSHSRRPSYILSWHKRCGAVHSVLALQSMLRARLVTSWRLTLRCQGKTKEFLCSQTTHRRVRLFQWSSWGYNVRLWEDEDYIAPVTSDSWGYTETWISSSSKERPWLLHMAGPGAGLAPPGVTHMSPFT